MADIGSVKKAGAKFARAQAARDRARDELYAEIRAAHATGNVQPKELIDASGLSRQGVFDVLKKTGADDQPPADRPEVTSYP